MLKLENAVVIGEGMERICYLHPEDQEKVVKIAKEGAGGNNQNQCEFKTYNYLTKHHGQLDCISRCYGFSETDLGPGLICQCVRDYTGEISKTLLETLINPHEESVQDLKDIVADFCNHIVKHNIQLFDLNPLNIVLRQDQPGKYKAVSIDLKGRYANKEFIPFSTFIPYLSRKKIRRRANRLLDRMDFIRNNSEQFR